MVDRDTEGVIKMNKAVTIKAHLEIIKLGNGKDVLSLDYRGEYFGGSVVVKDKEEAINELKRIVKQEKKWYKTDKANVWFEGKRIFLESFPSKEKKFLKRRCKKCQKFICCWRLGKEVYGFCKHCMEGKYYD